MGASSPPSGGAAGFKGLPPCAAAYFLSGLINGTHKSIHEKEEHHGNGHAFDDVTRSALVCGNLRRKTMLGDCDCASFQLGTRFALLLALRVLALPPLFYGVWAGGFQLFVQMLMRRRILGRFFVLCIILKGETLAILFRGFGRVIRAAWSG